MKSERLHVDPLFVYGRLHYLLKLVCIQLVVMPAPREQLLVRPSLHDLAAVDNENHARFADRAELVGDHEARSPWKVRVRRQPAIRQSDRKYRIGFCFLNQF